MLNFDQVLFYNTYENLSKDRSFREIFYEIFIPLLSEIGVLWQTDTITPAHEHFISTLIKQKIIYNTEKFQSQNQKTSDTTFVLFLPDNEIHELGIMYLNLEIISRGHQSILLGQSVPMKSLVDLLSYYEHITFVSYFTIHPEKEYISQYLDQYLFAWDTILALIVYSFLAWILVRLLLLTRPITHKEAEEKLEDQTLE